MPNSMSRKMILEFVRPQPSVGAGPATFMTYHLSVDLS